jgi:hypothetical protein
MTVIARPISLFYLFYYSIVRSLISSWLLSLNLFLLYLFYYPIVRSLILSRLLSPNLFLLYLFYYVIDFFLILPEYNFSSLRLFYCDHYSFTVSRLCFLLSNHALFSVTLINLLFLHSFVRFILTVMQSFFFEFYSDYFPMPFLATLLW